MAQKGVGTASLVLDKDSGRYLCAVFGSIRLDIRSLGRIQHMIIEPIYSGSPVLGYALMGYAARYNGQLGLGDTHKEALMSLFIKIVRI